MNKYKSLIMGLLAIACASCTDDMFYDNSQIGEGEAKIRASVTFKNFTPALDGSRATGGTDGDVLNGIRNLYLFAYNETGETLLYNEMLSVDNNDLTVTDNNTSTPPGGSYEPAGSADLPTSTAQFDFDIPFGRYKIYAVANVSDADAAMLDPATVNTEDKLRAVKFDWDNANIAENGQMFGWFSADKTAAANAEVHSKAPVVVINRSSLQLSAWMRRLASKVTIAYNTRNLLNGVEIYIESARLVDIPTECSLGGPNKATASTVTDVYNAYEPSQVITYQNSDGAFSPTGHAGMRLLKSSGIKGSDHAANAKSLFFYENMQGNFEGESSFDKRQNPNAVGDDYHSNDPKGPDWKDKIEWGTWVEVKGYYICDIPGKMSQGPIIYRFMLGKNITYNYDAERNYHYKLTLNFNGMANDVDWHIEYKKEDVEIHTPEMFYVSYEYNQLHHLPIQIDGTPDDVLIEIIENNWAPYDPSQPLGVPQAVVGSNLPKSEQFRWNRVAWYAYLGADGTTDLNRDITPPCLGFLSLAGDEYDCTEMPPSSILSSYYYSQGYSPLIYVFNPQFNYYSSLISAAGGSNSYAGIIMQDAEDNPEQERWYGNQQVRVFKSDDFDFTNSESPNQKKIGSGVYAATVTKINVGSEDHPKDGVVLNIPLLTRPKSMIEDSGWTGSNPYDTYQRKATVRITVKNGVNEDGSPNLVSKDVPVFQVRKIVNPKGILRSASNTEPFDVRLSRLDAPGVNQFSMFESEGPWKAYVRKGDARINLSVLGNNSELKSGKSGGSDTIMGYDGSQIEFRVNFAGIGAGQTKCALIEVLYHDYTCVHRILVRQGYENDIEMVPGGAIWSSYDLYSANGAFATDEYSDEGPLSDPIPGVLTKNPLAQGTLFKRGNYRQGISQVNSAIYGPLIPVELNPLKLTTPADEDNEAAWGYINGVGSGSVYDEDGHFITYGYNWGWAHFNIDGQRYEVPGYYDFKSLTDNCDFAFGVLYGDGATTTQFDVSQAYGFSDPTNSTTTSNKGVRGCVAYNMNYWQEDDNSQLPCLFFSLGAQGMGRRNQFNCSDLTDAGALRYGDVDYELTIAANPNNLYRPIPYNLPYAPGALYWIKQIEQWGHSSGDDCAAWDINYFSYKFSSYTANCLGDLNIWVGGRGMGPFPLDSDAIPIKLIKSDYTVDEDDTE